MKNSTSIVLIVFGLLFLAGIGSGEPVRVLAQAVRVCLSCIGIG